MSSNILSVFSGKLSSTEESENLKQWPSLVREIALKNDENVESLLSKMIVFICQKRGTAMILKNNLTIDSNRLIEPVCRALTGQATNSVEVLNLMKSYSSASASLAEDHNARIYCISTLAMNWIRKNVDFFDHIEVTETLSNFILSCLRDVWSEIRSSTAKFVEQLTQGSNSVVWESLLTKCLAVCSTKGIDWQSLEGCLAATCGLIENLNKFDSNSTNKQRKCLMENKILAIIWPHITHPQATVREFAVRALTDYVLRSEQDEIDRYMTMITEHLLKKNNNPEEIEGYFTACIEIVKVINPETIGQHTNWVQSALDYIDNPAATVRQIASVLLKSLVGKRANSSAFFQNILQALVGPFASGEKISWESTEGRFMGIDAIFRVIVANHWLYNFTTSMESSLRLNRSEPTTDDYIQKQPNDHFFKLESNPDIAAELIALSKTQSKIAKTKKRQEFSTRKQSSSFEFLGNLKPVSMIDLCIQSKSSTKPANQNSMSELLTALLTAVAMNLDADKWELRRISYQVLPYVGETIRWYDMDLFWECLHSFFKSGTLENFGRSPKELAAVLLLSSWLQQADRICIQIEDKRLIASTRLKDYIFATKGMSRFIPNFLHFCQSNQIDRQSVTSARVLMQFLARTKIVELADSVNVSDVLHTAMKMSVSLMWAISQKLNIVEDSVKFGNKLGVIVAKQYPPPGTRPFLLYGSNNANDYNKMNTMNATGAEVAVIEQLLPEIAAILRHFAQDASEGNPAKVITGQNVEENAFIVSGSLLAPLARLLAIYSFDPELLPYITDTTVVIVQSLFNPILEPVQEESMQCIEYFLEQLYENVKREISESQSKANSLLRAYTFARIAFWGCRIVMKNGDDPWLYGNINISVKMAQIVAIVSGKLLSLVPSESDAPAPDLIATNNSSWNVVGTGEILRPTPAIDLQNEDLSDVDADDVEAAARGGGAKAAAKAAAKGGAQTAVGNQFDFDDDDDDDDNGNDFDMSDDDDDDELIDGDDDEMLLDDDLDEMLVEIVTDMRSMIPDQLLAIAIDSFSDSNEREMLCYLLM